MEALGQITQKAPSPILNLRNLLLCVCCYHLMVNKNVCIIKVLPDQLVLSTKY